MTPEGLVKRALNKLLDGYGSALYRNMPVPCGYGESMLDYVCCYKGVFFMLETKRRGKDMTDRQRICASSVIRAGGHVFRVHNEAHIEELKQWLDTL